ncbi:MAG: aldehyde reductase [Candidatus Chlorobium antarcticum]|jgi:dihydroflavonol-4-reductase|nr:aldehyde reductase [Candidatus Chlorobium antarcticum]
MTPEQTVCVTGASGYLASHIVKQLLEKEYRVSGTVRRAPSAYPWLTSLPEADNRLELVIADLLNEGSFNGAMQGCSTVMHTASPYVINVKNPEKDLLDPALKGTLEVLTAAMKTPSVKRVILTSSVAAITDEPDSSKILTEEDWNTRSSLKRNPYHYAKTMAERAAWEFMEKNRPGFSLVCINPSMVTGPSLGPALNTTNGMIRDIMSGVYPGIMDLNWGFVDAGDAAEAHILAMETPEASGRYICSAKELHMRDLVALLRSSGLNRYQLPKLDLSGPAGTALMKVLSWTQPRNTGTFIRTHIGHSVHYSNTRIQQELGLTFKPVEESIIEAVEDLIRHLHLPEKR